jgi:hypothetical protein
MKTLISDPLKGESMRMDKRSADLVTAALRAEENRLRALADDMERENLPWEAVMDELERVERGLKRLRRAA